MSDLKNGRIKGLSMPTAQKIAGYFGITVDELYGEEEQKEKPTVKDDGLSETHVKLFEIAKSLSVEEAEALLVFLQAKQKR